MTRSRPITFFAGLVAIPLGALALSACGGGGTATAVTPPKTANGTSATVGVAKNNSLGTVLVNSQGRTLYLFKADVGTKSACTGACTIAWPPLLANGNPTAGTALPASKLGTTTRPGGGRQVTYGGHPLYLFIKDQKPGQANGQDVTAFGAAWFALTPAGDQAAGAAPAPSSASGGSAGY